MRLRTLTATTVLAALVGLAGCTYGTPKPAAAKPAPSPTPSINCQDPTLNLAVYPECQAQLQGPAGAPHTWPNGLVAQVAGLQKMDPKLGADLKAGQTLVKLTVTLANRGSQPIPLDQNRYLWRLLASPNRYEVDNDGGWNTTADQIISPVPEQVAPGQTVTVLDAWDVPNDQFGVLAVRVDLAGMVAPWTFVDAQTMLKG